MEKKMLNPAEVCDYVEQVGIKKANNHSLQTLILGILAGAFIALGGFAAAMASHSIGNVGVAKLVAGTIFPVGLILVLVCGAELFTGNCLLTIAYVQKKISMKAMLKNWSLVYIGNLIGALIIVGLLVSSNALTANEGKLGAYTIKVAVHKTSLTFGQALASGILCNIVVCLAVWGSYASKDIVGKIFITFFPIMAFIISGFEHVVANMYYLSIGFLAKMNPAFVEASHIDPQKIANIDIAHIIENLIPVTIGNIIGGGIFVGLAYFVVYKGIPSKNTQVNSEKSPKSLSA